MSVFARPCPICGARTEPGARFCPAHAGGVSGRPSSCEICGRLTIGLRCELHPITEAERLAREPWRRGYGSAAYRRNRPIVLERAAGVCECGCGQPLREHPHVGHVVALSDGGSDELANLRAMRPACNYRQMGIDTRARRRRAKADS